MLLYTVLKNHGGGDCAAMILAAVQATFWPIRVFGVCSLGAVNRSIFCYDIGATVFLVEVLSGVF